MSPETQKRTNATLDEMNRL